MPFNPFSALTSKIFGGVALAALAFATAQTIRIEGFLFIHGFKQDLADRDKQIVDMKAASKANRAEAERQAKEQQAKLDAATKDANDAYKQAQQVTDDRTRAYLASHRLRADCGISAPATVAEGKDSGVPAGVQADTGMVAIRETDLQALVDWLQIGVAAHNEAVAKVNSGAAMPDPAMGR